MSQYFYRIEHQTDKNLNLIKFLFAPQKENYIGHGPWFKAQNRFSLEELLILGKLSLKHRPPSQDPNKGDNVIFELTENMHPRFVFGCRTKSSFFKYFSSKRILKVLNKHSFVLKVFESENIVSSKYQSAMDISKPFKVICEYSLGRFTV